MGYNRGLIQSVGGGLPAVAGVGSGFICNLSISEVAGDTNQTITTGIMQRGGVNYTGFSAGRNLITPTGAQLTAAFPEMDVNDSISFFVSIQDAFAGTWVAGDANVALAGRATTPASSWSLVVCTRGFDVAGVRQYLWRVM